MTWLSKLTWLKEKDPPPPKNVSFPQLTPKLPCKTNISFQRTIIIIKNILDLLTTTGLEQLVFTAIKFHLHAIVTCQCKKKIMHFFFSDGKGGFGKVAGVIIQTFLKNLLQGIVMQQF